MRAEEGAAVLTKNPTFARGFFVCVPRKCEAVCMPVQATAPPAYTRNGTYATQIDYSGSPLLVFAVFAALPDTHRSQLPFSIELGFIEADLGSLLVVAAMGVDCQILAALTVLLLTAVGTATTLKPIKLTPIRTLHVGFVDDATTCRQRMRYNERSRYDTLLDVNRTMFLCFTCLTWPFPHQLKP